MKIEFKIHSITFIEDMEHIPRIGDVINLSGVMGEKDLNKLSKENEDFDGENAWIHSVNHVKGSKGWYCFISLNSNDAQPKPYWVNE